MIVKNTKATRSVQQAVATMAILGMYFEREFIEKMIKVANGEKNQRRVETRNY